MLLFERHLTSEMYENFPKYCSTLSMLISILKKYVPIKADGVENFQTYHNLIGLQYHKSSTNNTIHFKHFV